MENNMGRLKQVVTAADAAGYNKQERRKLIANPFKFIEDNFGPKLTAGLNKETIAAFLGKLEGKKNSDQRLLDLGNLLYEYNKHLETASAEMHDEEIRLLSFANVLFENAMYDGKFSILSGKSAATTAFLINRLAKLKESDAARGEATGFSKQRFTTLMKEVETFAEWYFSENHLDELIVNQQDQESIERRSIEASSKPEAIELLEAVDARSRLQKESDDLATSYPEYAKRHFAKLREAVEFFDERFAYSKEKIEHIESLEKYLQLLEETKMEDFARYMEHSATRNTYSLFDFRTKKPNEMGGSGYHNLPHIYFSLKVWRDELAQKKTQKSKAMTLEEFTKVQTAKRIDEYLESFEEVFTIDPKQGPVKQRRDLHARIQEESKKLKVLLTAIQTDPELYAHCVKFIEHRNEQSRLRRLRPRLPEMKQIFYSSSRSVADDARGKKAFDLYFLKDMLVASDVLARERSQRPYSEFTEVKPPRSQAIQVHEFIDIEYTKRYQEGYSYYDAPRIKTFYSDIHYKETTLPFTQILNEYLTKKAAKT